LERLTFVQRKKRLVTQTKGSNWWQLILILILNGAQEVSTKNVFDKDGHRWAVTGGPCGFVAPLGGQPFTATLVFGEGKSKCYGDKC